MVGNRRSDETNLGVDCRQNHTVHVVCKVKMYEINQTFVTEDTVVKSTEVSTLATYFSYTTQGLVKEETTVISDPMTTVIQTSRFVCSVVIHVE